MNPLWLLLIVPVTGAIGYAIACFMWMADDSDERTIDLLYRQYSELCAVIENAWPKPKGLPEVRARHDTERDELIG